MARKNNFIEEIGKNIGKKIQFLRTSLGLSREHLAEKIGVSHQQLMKYEHGTNRLSVGRLVLIANALSKDISYFYEDFIGTQTPVISTQQRICLELSKNFMKIGSPEHQTAVNSLVKSLAKVA